MKLAIAGKGGVGKTFISATLSRLLARDGYGVLAIDADPAMNLAYALGIPVDLASKIVPICENNKLIEERTGAKPGSGFGSIFSLTPTVNDIADRFGVSGPDGVKLLVMGTVRAGGTGCLCPANALLRVLIQHIMMERKEAVVMDMEAGLEHLGRATIRGVDAVIAVVEPGAQSVETARRIKKLASDIGLRDVLAVGNKIRTEEDSKFIESSLKNMGLKPSCIIPFDQMLLQADMQHAAPIDFAPSSPAVEAVRELEAMLRQRYGQ